MILKKTDEDYTDEEYSNIVEPHLDNVMEYMAEYAVPDVICYYIGMGYYTSRVHDDSLDIFIQTVFDFFNISNLKNDKVKEKIKEKVKNDLKIKYKLEITNEDPLKLKEI